MTDKTIKPGASNGYETSVKTYTEAVFKEKYGVCDPMLELTIVILSHSQLCSRLSSPTTKGKGWSGEDLSYWLSTFVSKTGFLCNHKYREGEGRDES